MFTKFSLSALALGGICLLNACASEYQISPTKPADCITARRDITYLQNETAVLTEQSIHGKKTAVPFSAVASILSGPYDDRTAVPMGQYLADMKSKMRQIRNECPI